MKTVWRSGPWWTSGTWHSGKAAVLGGTFGAFAAFLVTHALMEISFNKYFCVLFALGCFLLGGVVAHRAAGLQDPSDSRPKQLLYSFAVMLALAGGCSSFVEKEWFAMLPAIAKVPMYCFIGTALTFALSFGCVDCANFMVDILGGTKRAAPIRNGRQVSVIVISSVAIGALFGFFFGLLDVEDKGALKLREDKFFCVPIATLASAVAAVVVQKLGHPACQYGIIPQDDDDDEMFFGGDQ
eukprot:Polyplicarium_translucidae@DN2689_c0_g1_i3.p1